jgi:hypothetical protein
MENKINKLLCIENLVLAAIHHKAICTQSDCNVSLRLIREAALWIRSSMTSTEERDKALEFIELIPY